ncbi:hypothetical protein VHUM_02365 [Vanrija humicola]|uniref:Uncharacterized protein n=1 Tax=Vanrija humicola TaxID=5417 RepID=A0A7D8Z4I0_VANHU|nr:hypothetical protein VHUM_02365 [Vanrija humicola]
MKFTQGTRWLDPLAGIHWRAAVEVTEVIKETDDELDFTAAVIHVADRKDTVSQPVIFVNISSPMEDVIKVRIDHHTGGEDGRPGFELFPDGKPAAPKTKVSRKGKDITFTSGSLSANLSTEESGFNLSFLDATKRGKDQLLTEVGYKGIGFADVPYRYTLNQESEKSRLSADPGALVRQNGMGMEEHRTDSLVRYMHNNFLLNVNENIYGLGERFGSYVKNGQVVGMFNDDHATHSTMTYKNVPFYLSSRGFGVFMNHPEEVEYEVGHDNNSGVNVSVRGETIEYFIVGGGSPKAALLNYVAMVGRPALPPAWTFGLYLSTSFTTSYDQKTVTGFLQQMRDRDCPVRVLHLDCFWMKAYDWCSFEFDPDMFPDPKKYLADVKREFNVKVCAWINPYISQRSAIFKEGKEKGYFIKRANGTVWQWDWWQPGMALVDFTNPEAWKWYQGLVTRLIETGVDTVKTDFGERCPHKDAVFFDGSDARKMHNYYSVLYNKCTFEAVEAALGKDEAAVWARSASAGGQRFPVHWGGDPQSTWQGMAESLRGGLSLAMSGFAFHSHDIGGFIDSRGPPSNELFARWCAFGMFSTHSRMHGCGTYRVPWDYGEESVRVTSRLGHEKMRLMPYIYGQAVKAHKTGLPVLRSMFLEFPDDAMARYLDKQYMLGDSLLVAPVFGSDAEYYIPEGRWTDYWTGEVIEGPKHVRKEDYPIDLIPLFVRPNSVLLLGPENIGVPDYDYATVGLEVRKYEVTDEVEVDVPHPKGSKLAGTVKVTPDGKVSASAGVSIKKKDAFVA